MAINRTFGEIVKEGTEWIITAAEPHVRIKLKAVFESIPKTHNPPYNFPNTIQICTDILWFIQRYPLKISQEDMKRLEDGAQMFADYVNELEQILIPEYIPNCSKFNLKDGFAPRKYQTVGFDLFEKVRRILIADQYGLGKTLIAILGMMDKRRLPVIVVVQTHLYDQWRKMGIEKFTFFKSHLIKGTRPYNLPEADVYIMKYSCIRGWGVFFDNRFFKYAVFDEIQELRSSGTAKYAASRILSENVDWVMGLSATPIYNYGGEIYSVMQIIKPNCLGQYYDFAREWGGDYRRDKLLIKDPAALGTFLRENYLMLRRTREEVDMELPNVNTIVEWIEADEDAVEDERKIAKQLALDLLSSTNYTESGELARELNMRLRHMTGVAKAKGVAAFAKILLEAGEPILLAGWHRDVYDIWLSELMEYEPVMYTGSESPKQKLESYNKFMEGKTNLMIISLRSGAGLDGLQYRSAYCIVGELDYSPQVHGQLVARLDRPGAPRQVTAIYPVVDFGSDPMVMDILGIKSSQSHGIIDPLHSVKDQYTDRSMLKEMAEKFLRKENVDVPKFKIDEQGELKFNKDE